MTANTFSRLRFPLVWRLPNKHFIPLLIALAFAAGFVELGRMDVWSDNEGQRATPPAEMIRNGQYLIPTLNGADYLAKPPLLYWAIAAVYAITGVISPFTARIPTAACYVALIVAAYFFLRREAGEKPARWAALMLLASPYLLERARFAELDVPLTLSTFLAIIAFHNAARAVNRMYIAALIAGGGLALAAAIMLKGPVPFLFIWAALIAQAVENGRIPLRSFAPIALGCGALFLVEFIIRLLAIAAHANPGWLGFPYALAVLIIACTFRVFQFSTYDRMRLLGIWLLIAIVGIGLATPWAVAVFSAKGGGYIETLLHSQVVERTYTASRINSGLPTYYALALPVLLAPWGLLLPFHFSRSQWQRRPRIYRFSLVTGWLSVAVFSLIAGKEYEYILPAFPFLLCATGFHVAEMYQIPREGWVKLVSRVWLVVIPVMMALLGVAGIVHVIRERESLALILETLLLCGTATVAAFYALRFRRHGLPYLFVSSLCIVIAALLITRSYHYRGERSPKALAQLTGELVRAGRPVEASIVYPAFAFYAGVTVPVEDNQEEVFRKLSRREPYYYVTREKFLELGRLRMAMARPRILTDAYTNKELVLIGNKPLPKGFEIVQ